MKVQTKNKQRSTLRTKIIAWSFVPTVIILAAVAWFTFYAYQQVTAQLVMAQDQELTQAKASQVTQAITEWVNPVILSLTLNVDTNKAAPLSKRAALILTQEESLSLFDGGIVFLDTAGKVVTVAPERPDIMGQDWSDRSYFQQAKRSPGQAEFTDTVPDGPHGQLVVPLALAMLSERGEFVGAMVLLFQIDSPLTSGLYHILVQRGLGDSIYILDSHNRVIFHPDPQQIGSDFSGKAYLPQLFKGPTNTGLFDRESGRVVVSYAPVPGTVSWRLVKEQNWTNLIRPSLSYQYLLLALLALGVLVPALVVTVGVRRIIQPIQELIGAAQNMADGHFEQQITASTGDEIEELAEQFNRMSAQLQESYTLLEQRVADRTRELATLNAIAAAASSSLDLDEMLNSTLDRLVELVAASRIGVMLLDDASGELVPRAIRPEHDVFSEDLAQMTKIGQQVIISNKTLYGTPNSEFGVAEPSVWLPLRVRGRMLGILGILGSAGNKFSPEQQALFESIADQLGVAVENARLYRQAEITAVQAERNRLARDLHDSVSQTLFSTSLIAEVLPRLWEQNPAEGQRRLQELRELTRGALAEMRTLLLELRPTALADTPLADLLRQLAESVTGWARVRVNVAVEDECNPLSEVKTALYRIAQEALNNAARHARANQVQVNLSGQPDEIVLQICDNGCGFDPAAIPPDHLGLGIMHERAESIGAILKIESQAGEGTQVIVTWSKR
ncbi:MAG: HAMP domain-containing protein [Anaerolineae bacterium]|nr:HAMP domain-containing protein [Anaerolineae bacterium]